MDLLLKNSQYTVKIEAYSADGSAVARIDGQVVFIKGALRGELCEIKIVKVLKNMAYGRLENVIEPSPHRISPSCNVFGKCGGCDFQHMDYEEELSLKKQRVDDAFERIGGLALRVSAMHGAPAIESYRNKAIYAIGMKDGKAVAGFFRERSHDIVPINRCNIQSEAADKIAAVLCRWIDKYSISIYDEGTVRGLIRHLFVRTAFNSGQIAVCIIAAGNSLPNSKELVSDILGVCPEVSSIVLGVNKKPGNTVLGDRFIKLWGSDYIEEALCGLKFKLSPKSFFQVNPAQAENLYEKSVEFACAGEGETALDLFCGTGTIALILAKKAGFVFGVEVVPEAIADAKENAAANSMKNVEFICGDAALASLELKKRGVTPTSVIVDPPRKGLTPELIETIAAMSPERVVYVSCDPATLARDLKQFEALGYRAERAEAFDMFPRTAHIECCVRIERLKG